MTEGDVSPQNDSVNVDEFAQIKANIPTTHTNPLKLIDASGLLEPAAASDEETVTFFEAINLPENSQTKQVLVRVTIAMVTLPIFAFFFSYYLLFTPADYGGDLLFQDSLTYSGVVAVVTVNIIMGFFVFYAMRIDPHRDEGYENAEENIAFFAARQAKLANKKAASTAGVSESKSETTKKLKTKGKGKKSKKTSEGGGEEEQGSLDNQIDDATIRARNVKSTKNEAPQEDEFESSSLTKSQKND